MRLLTANYTYICSADEEGVSQESNLLLPVSLAVPAALVVFTAFGTVPLDLVRVPIDSGTSVAHQPLPFLAIRFLVSPFAMPFMVVLDISFLSGLLSSVQHPNHQCRRRAGRKPQLFPYNNLFPQRHRKDHPKEAQPQRPEHQLPKRQPQPSRLLRLRQHRVHDLIPTTRLRRLTALQQELQRRHHTHKPTTQRHRPNTPRHSLHQHILHLTELRSPPQLFSNTAQPTHQRAQAFEIREPDQRRRHRHPTDPSCLQPEIGVAESDEDADEKSEKESAECELRLIAPLTQELGIGFLTARDRVGGVLEEAGGLGGVGGGRGGGTGRRGGSASVRRHGRGKNREGEEEREQGGVEVKVRKEERE